MTDRERIKQVIKNTENVIMEIRKDKTSPLSRLYKADGMELVVTALKNIFEK